MERDYNVLYTYITKRVYTSDFDVYKKRSLRRKAEQYDVDNGELMYMHTCIFSDFFCRFSVINAKGGVT